MPPGFGQAGDEPMTVSRTQIVFPTAAPNAPGIRAGTRVLPRLRWPRVARGGTRGSPALKDWRLPPDAPDLAQGVARLAEGRVRAGGFHERRHEVRAAGGVAFHPREGGLDGSGIAPRAERRHAFHL